MDYREELIERFLRVDAADLYAFGWFERGRVYGCLTEPAAVREVAVLEKATAHRPAALRFTARVADRQYLRAVGYVVDLCSEQAFRAEMAARGIRNAGDYYECYITELCGQTWRKDNVPCNKAGDLRYKGKEIQVKFYKGTFTNEQTLANFERASA